MTTSDDLDRLGRAVRTMRKILDLTQDEVTAQGGPSDVTIRGLENGSGKRPNGDTLRKLDIGLRWPAGFASKVLRGDADVLQEVNPDGSVVPNLFDYTKAPPPREMTSEELERSYEAFQGMDATEDLAHEVAVRDNMLARRNEELLALERELAVARVKLEATESALRAARNELAHLRRDDAERLRQASPEDAVDTGRIPLPDDAYGLAAMRGPSKGKTMKREMDAVGEESQDPGTEEPA